MYKFVKEGGRYYCYERRHWWNRWKPFRYHSFISGETRPQQSFKTVAEIVNNFLRNEDVTELIVK